MAKKKSKPKDDDEKPKKRPAAVADDDDDGDDDRPSRTVKPRNDAFTGLLVITLLGLIASTVLLYLDHEELSAQTVSAPNVSVPALGAQSDAPAAPGTPPGMNS